MIIRLETPQDASEIEQVTLAAFAGKPYSDQTEHLIIQRLRELEALSLSLVADVEGRVIGQVTFSDVTIDGENCHSYGLGPVSVLPEFQRQGLGSKLIKAGLARIREMGAQGCALEGSPAYYQRFGFKPYPGFFYEGAPSAEYFMALPFFEEIPQGKVEFHPAFYVSA